MPDPDGPSTRRGLNRRPRRSTLPSGEIGTWDDPVRCAMRWLIDGYNVMHAAGRLGPKLSREGFRRARRRFLDELADVLPLDRRATSPSSSTPRCPPATSRSRRPIAGSASSSPTATRMPTPGSSTSSATTRAPRRLTVVSSDRRIREAASRRRARPLTADAFLGPQGPAPAFAVSTARSPQPETDRDAPMDADEAAFWAEAFREVDDLPGIREVGLARAGAAHRRRDRRDPAADRPRELIGARRRRSPVSWHAASIRGKTEFLGDCAGIGRGSDVLSHGVRSR